VDGVEPECIIAKSAILCSFVLFDIIKAVSKGLSPKSINPDARLCIFSLYSLQDIASQPVYSALIGVFIAG
jgi:hypothetical protein